MKKKRTSTRRWGRDVEISRKRRKKGRRYVEE
jgi:hypothetical protein